MEILIGLSQESFLLFALQQALQRMMKTQSPTHHVPKDPLLNCFLSSEAYYTKYFKENGIDTIVRLCKVEYEAADFQKDGLSRECLIAFSYL